LGDDERRQRQYEAVAVVLSDDFADKSGLSVRVERSNVTADEQPSWKLQAQFEAIFPIAPLFNREQILRMSTSSSINGTIAYQHDEDHDTIIEIQARLFRDQDQLKFAKESPETERCVEDEKRGFPTTDNCDNSTSQASSLNHIHVYATYSHPVSKWVYNVSSHVRDALVANYYDYVETNAAQEPHEQEDLQESSEEQHQHIRVRQEQKATYGDKIVSGFYNSEGCQRSGKCKLSIDKIPAQLYTHLIYGYASVDPDSAQIISTNPSIDLPPYQQSNGQDGYRRFNRLKAENPQMKTFLCVGGPEHPEEYFSRLVADPEKRATFAKSAVRFVKQYDFNGLDIYWQYPRTSADQENYVQLLKLVSEDLDQSGLELSVTMPGVKSQIEEGYNVREVFRYADLVNVMAFNYHSPSESKTAMNAPLYADSADSEQDKQNTVSYIVEYLIRHGADIKKMILGIPTSGLGYILHDSSQNRVHAPVRGPTPAEPCTRTPGVMGYNEICAKLRENRSWNVRYPKSYVEPYAVKGDKWISFDDPSAVREKAAMVVAMGLKGAVVESIDLDDFNGYCGQSRFPLTRAVLAGLHRQRSRQQYAYQKQQSAQLYSQQEYQKHHSEGYKQRNIDQAYYHKDAAAYQAAYHAADYQPAAYKAGYKPAYRAEYYEADNKPVHHQYYAKRQHYRQYLAAGMEDQIQFEIVFHPDTDVVSATIQTPEEKLRFSSVPVSPFVDAVFPLELNQRVSIMAIDYALAGQYAPSCTLEGDHVSTFDNKTYEYDMNSCYHVAAMDCSPRGNLSIVAYETDTPGMKALRIHAGNHLVQVIPTAGKQSPMKIMVGRHELEIPVGEVREQHESDELGEDQLWLIVKRPQVNAIVLESPTFGFHIASDGYTNEISFSNLYRNNTCGMCGDFDGQKEAEFKDPQARVLSEGALSAISYAMESSRCHQLDRELLAQLKEEQDLHIYSYPQPSLRESTRRSGLSSYHGSSASEESEDERQQCDTQNEKLIRYVDGKQCVSVNKQPKCSQQCRPASGSQLKSVQFECDSGDQKTLKVIQPIRCASRSSSKYYSYYNPYSQYYDLPKYFDQSYNTYVKSYSQYYKKPYYLDQYYQKPYYTGNYYARQHTAPEARAAIKAASMYYDQYDAYDATMDKASKYYDAKQPYAVEYKEYPSYDQYYANPEAYEKKAYDSYYHYPKYYQQYYDQYYSYPAYSKQYYAQKHAKYAQQFNAMSPVHGYKQQHKY